MTPRPPPPDPLKDTWIALRDALDLFGITVESRVLQDWRRAWAACGGLFTGTGEFSPIAVERLERAVALIRQSTADAPAEPE